MPFIAGDIVEVTVAARMASQNGLNVRHYIVQTILGTGATDLQVATGFDTQYKAVYLPVLSSTSVWYGTKVQKIFPAPKGAIITIINNVTPGTAAGGPLPSQVTGLMAQTTAIAGRSFRGRKYIPFPTQSFSTAAGDPTAAYLTLLNSIAVQDVTTVTYGTSPNQTTFRPVIWSPTRTVSTNISNSFGRPGWGTQRRRGDIRRPDVVPW